MPPRTTPTTGVTTRRLTAALTVAGIVLIALNLRPAVASMGALLGDARAALHMSGVETGLLTTLPLLAFGIVGGVAPALSRWLGGQLATVLAVLTLAAALLARPWAGSGTALLAWTALACSGIAVANVLLPALVKAFFPHRLGLVTGMYTMAMQLGTALSAAVAVPLAQVTGGWRSGLASWGIVAAVAVIPWLVTLRGSAVTATATAGHDRSPSVPLLLRSPVTWGVIGLFGMQSLGAYVVLGWLPQIYRDAGLAPATAGMLLGLVTAVAAPFGLLLPTLATRRGDQRPFAVVVTLASGLGYGGLMVAPVAGAWLWPVLIGVGNAAFPLALTLIGMRARSLATTTRLSAIAQSLGYLLASGGPLAVGIIHDATGGWGAPLILLIALLVPQLVAGLAAGRNRYLEDTIAPLRAAEARAPAAVLPTRCR